MSNFSISQIQGNVNTNTHSALKYGKEIPIDHNWTIMESGDIKERNHRSFGGIEVGRNDELFVVFRAGYSHGITISSGQKGGNLYYATSHDCGKTWSDPVLFLEADVGRDLRDVVLTYDNFYDKYILTYADLDVDYTKKDSVTHILIGDEPFENMQDITPTMPFTLLNQTFTRPVRYGEWLYLPLYGLDTVTNKYDIALLRTNSGVTTRPGAVWEIVKKWEGQDGDNEVSAFVSYDEITHKPRFNLLMRRNDEGFVTYCEDDMVTWSEKQGVGFDCAGGPNVFNLDGTLVLVARDQSISAKYGYGFIAYSKDGLTWSDRAVISDSGPVYPLLARFKNGKTLLSYCKEYSSDGHIYIREILNIPTIG